MATRHFSCRREGEEGGREGGRSEEKGRRSIEGVPSSVFVWRDGRDGTDM